MLIREKNVKLCAKLWLINIPCSVSACLTMCIIDTLSTPTHVTMTIIEALSLPTPNPMTLIVISILVLSITAYQTEWWHSVLHLSIELMHTILYLNEIDLHSIQTQMICIRVWIGVEIDIHRTIQLLQDIIKKLMVPTDILT